MRVTSRSRSRSSKRSIESCSYGPKPKKLQKKSDQDQKGRRYSNTEVKTVDERHLKRVSTSLEVRLVEDSGAHVNRTSGSDVNGSLVPLRSINRFLDSGTSSSIEAVESADKVDKYCWLCHREANDKICHTCHRAYHNRCLDKAGETFSELGVCVECRLKSVDGTELNSNKYLNLEKLKKIFVILTRRSFARRRGRNDEKSQKKIFKEEIFLEWPEKDREKLFKIIDFQILLDNINHVLPYTKTAEFYSDVKYICHNTCIVYGANSEQAKAAENLRRDFKTELLDLEACPECYFHLYCNEHQDDKFIRLCDPPHDIVWAKLTGHPYWSAKCLKVVKDVAHVKFFGEHEQANIPIQKCYHISKCHPKNKNPQLTSSISDPKSQRYKAAKLELQEYVHLYEKKYGTFKYEDHRKIYTFQAKPKKVVSHSIEGTNRTCAEMKRERYVNEEPERNYLNPVTVEDFSEEENLNSITITNSNGQYPTHDEIHPSVDSSFFNPSPDPPTGQAVTSINMTFDANENNRENAIEVGTEIGSLQRIFPYHHSSTTVRSMDSGLMHSFDRFLEHEVPETVYGNISSVHGSETISTTVTNNVSSDLPIQPEPLNDVMDNSLPNLGNRIESDDEEIQYIKQTKSTQDEHYNPSVILPAILAQDPELQRFHEKAHYLTDGVIVGLWARTSNKTSNVASYSKLYVENAKLKLENENLKKNNSLLNQELEDERQKHCSENELWQSRYQNLEARYNDQHKNAKMVIASIRSNTEKKITKGLRAEYEAKLKEEKDNNIILKQLLEEEKKKHEETVDKFNFYKTNINTTTISHFKKKHFCFVCERPATSVCCLHTSYCSEECQSSHAPEHQKDCLKSVDNVLSEKISFEESKVLGIFRKLENIPESSVIRDSYNSATKEERDSDLDSLTHTRSKKARSQHASALPALPATQDLSAASSSRSYSPNSKRRSHR